MMDHGNHSRVTRAAALGGVLLAALALLPGCAHNTATSALELMRDQQAQAQAQEDALDKRKAPSKPEVAMSLIKESQAQGRYFASLAYIDAYRKQFGDAPELAALRADALRMTNQPEAAEQAYRALVNSDQSGLAWRGLGLLAGARGDYAAAADDLTQAAQAYPADASVLSDLGYARLRAGDLAGARVPLGQAAELDPANVKVLGNLALLLLADGDTAGAARVMDQANLPQATRDRVHQLALEMQRTRVSSSTVPSEAARQMQLQASGSASASAATLAAASTAAASTRAPAQQSPHAAGVIAVAQGNQPRRAVVRNMSDPSAPDEGAAAPAGAALAAAAAPTSNANLARPAPVALPDNLQTVMSRFSSGATAP
jgi:Flp pilus assembly protein TadD